MSELRNTYLGELRALRDHIIQTGTDSNVDQLVRQAAQAGWDYEESTTEYVNVIFDINQTKEQARDEARLDRRRAA